MIDVKDVESGLGIDASEEIGGVKNIIMAKEADIKLAGMWSTVVSILKTMIGAGILGLPYAFLSGGWLFSIFVFPVIALLTGYCMIALIRAKETANLSRTSDPADVGEVGFGAAGRIIVAVILCADSFGVCLSYFIFITYNMFLLTNVRQEIWAVIFFFFFLLVSYIRPVAYISYMTLFANCLTLIGIIVTLVAVFVAADRIGEPHLFNWAEFPLFIGIVLFAFQAINIAIPAHNTLKNQKRFTLATIVVLSIACVAYLLFGLIVYLRLADNSLSMITEAINVFGVQVAVAVLFIISLCVNMICWIYPIYEISDRLFCANKFFVISEKEKARLLAENEAQNMADAAASAAAVGVGTPVSSINPAATPNPETPPTTTNASADAGAADSARSRPSSSSGAVQAVEDISQDQAEPSMVSDDVQVFPVVPVETVNASVASADSDDATAAAADATAVGTAGKETAAAAAVAVTASTTTEGEGGAETEAGAEPGFIKRILINWKFWILSTVGRIVVLLIIMIPSVTPARDHFESFMGLSGCLTGILMSFIMPMCAQLKIQWKTMPLWQKILDIVILVVSTPAMIYVTVMTLIDLVNSIRDSE